MRALRRSGMLAIPLIVLFVSVVNSPAQAEEWDWTFTPYLWASDVGADVAINGEPALGTDVAFADLFSKLKFAVPLHLEASCGKHAFFFDINYINLGDDQTFVGHPPLPDDSALRSEMQQTIIEIGGAYRPSQESHGLDILYGVRVLDLDMTYAFTLPPPSMAAPLVESSGTFTDGFVGLRYNAPVGKRSSIGIRGDVGAGGSELTWNVSALLGYQIGKQRQNTLLIGYRHMEIDFDNSSHGADVGTVLTMSGPITGIAIRF